MSLKVPTKQQDYAPIPEGTYTAICYGVVDIGMQYNEKFKKTSAKVVIIWEIDDDELREDFGRGMAERRAISKAYTMSFNEKSTLYKDIRPWIGAATFEKIDEFNLSELAGKPCLLTITNNEGSDKKVYANVAGVSRLTKGMTVGKPENAIVVYDCDEPDEDEFKRLPDWVQKKIQDSKSPNSKQANSVSVAVDTETGEVLENSDGGKTAGTPTAEQSAATPPPKPKKAATPPVPAPETEALDDEDIPF